MSFLLAQRELAPEEDNASIFVFASPPDYANIDYVNAYTQQMIDLWRTIPEIRTAWQVNQQDQSSLMASSVAWKDLRTLC
jgi:multidrug efflux pump